MCEAKIKLLKHPDYDAAVLAMIDNNSSCKLSELLIVLYPFTPPFNCFVKMVLCTANIFRTVQYVSLILKYTFTYL